jgi:subtilisin family serine protease
VDCFQPGQICVFPSPEGEPGQFADLLASGDLPADFEGVETTFGDVLEANLAALERSDGVSYGSFVEHSSSLPMRDFAVLRVREGREHESAAQFLQVHGVGYAAPNYLLAATGSRGETIDELRKLVAAVPRAPSPRCGDNVRVAVVDSGVDEEALAETTDQPGWTLNASFDAFASPGRPVRPGDDSGHGTAVATIINTAAPGARLVSIRVFSHAAGTLSSLVNGLLLAACLPDVAVINLSVSGTPGNCGDCGRVAQTGVEIALGKLLSAAFRGDPPLVLAAAGNREGPRPLAFPASSEEVVAVGSFEAATNGTVYTGLDPQRFFLAHDLSAARTRFKGTSFACALTSGFAARYACAFRNSSCGSWPHQATQGQLRPLLRHRLIDTADRTYPGYDPTLHGQGLATLQ